MIAIDTTHAVRTLAGVHVVVPLPLAAFDTKRLHPFGDGGRKS